MVRTFSVKIGYVNIEVLYLRLLKFHRDITRGNTDISGAKLRPFSIGYRGKRLLISLPLPSAIYPNTRMSRRMNIDNVVIWQW